MNELIQQARELCEKATPGPWYNFGDWMIHTEPDVEHNGIPNEKTIGTVRANNAAFIAASRTLVPQLCDALETAQKEIERLHDLLADRNVLLDKYESDFDTLTARAEKAEAERDAANKCIYDTETYFDIGANKFAYRTIKQYTHDAAEPPKGV